MSDAFALVLSLLRFIAEEAPHLVDDVRTLVTAWASKKGIPHEEILPALDLLAPRVKVVDDEIDGILDSLRAERVEDEKTPPAGTSV